MNWVLILLIIMYLFGYAIAFYLVRLDFKKSIIIPFKCNFSFWDYFFICIFSLFSWVTVIVGLFINGVKGNFSK